MNPPQFRVWVGWRAESLRKPGSGWQKFLDDLSRTFIPATWMVMPRYGLRSYVPSVTRPGLQGGCPEETALLVYETRASYEGHKATVGGRSYNVMHRAVFNFGDPHDSRAAWAERWNTPPQTEKPRLVAWFWDGASGGFLLDSAQASIVYVLVAHDPGPQRPADELYQALGYTEGQVVLCPTDTFTVAWIAVAAGSEARPFADALAGALKGGQVQAAHVARAAAAAEDYFAGPDCTVPLSEDETLRFL